MRVTALVTRTAILLVTAALILQLLAQLLPQVDLYTLLLHILHDNHKCVLVYIFIETTLPYLQSVREHGDVLPPGDSLNGSVSIPLANGFPYGKKRFFQINVSTHIR